MTTAKKAPAKSTSAKKKAASAAVSVPEVEETPPEAPETDVGEPETAPEAPKQAAEAPKVPSLPVNPASKPAGKVHFASSSHARGVKTPSGASFTLSPGAILKMTRTDAEDLAAAGYGSIQGD